jgi:Flp pilus assembly protein TadD
MKNFLRRISGNLRETESAAVKTAAPDSSQSPQEFVALALAHHGAGRIGEAESLYRKALAVDPENFDALHMLGVVNLQAGQAAGAVALIEQAISVAPGNAIAYSNLGLAQQSMGRLEDAVASLRTAVRLQPELDGAHNSLGTMLRAAGQAAAAEASFRKAVQLNPGNVNALNNLGNLYRERGSLAEAEEFHRAALAFAPDAFGTWRVLGEVQQLAGRLDDALISFRKALELRPEDPGALADLGSLHAARAELVESETYFRLALQIDADRADAWCNLGDVLRRLDRLDEAESCCRRAAAMRPDDPDVLNTLACVLLRTRALDEAETCCRRALSVRRDHAATQITLGSILNLQDRPGEAEACFRSALRLQPGSASARYNLSMLKLLQGDYEEGLQLYESRFETLQGDIGVNPALQALLRDSRRWHGEPLGGKRLLVWTEQGFGDSIMTLRYLPLLKERGAGSVIVLCEPELTRLVGSLAGMEPAHCVQSVSAMEFDVHCPIMSLPLLFGTTRDAIPGVLPYVVVPESMSDVWKARLASITKRRVGLVWAGNQAMRDGAGRSIPLAAFASVLRSDQWRVVSLQKGEGAEQTDAWRGHIEVWMDQCGDFLDTAALVQNLDLVVAIDSAMAHLAGAMGKPVWLLNRHGREWRWGLQSERTPWYPSMRIFRQGKGEGWEQVIAQVVDELAAEHACKSRI